MAVISVSVVESTEEIVADFPKYLVITTNIPAIIFYTLDGTDPTNMSSIFVDKLYLPTDKLSLTVKILATNGADSSVILTYQYSTNILDNTRLPHSTTDARPNDPPKMLYPLGTNPTEATSHYLNPANSSYNIYDPSKPATSLGFDANGNPNNFTSQDPNEIPFVYSTTNKQGKSFPNVGTLSGHVKIEKKPPPPIATSTSSKLFDPRALVIFQDVATENPEDPPFINKMSYTSYGAKNSRDGNMYFTTGLESPASSGSFIRSHFNPRDNTITYYYRDSITNQWIISKVPYNPNNNPTTNLSGMILSKPGAGFVFGWRLFARRVLF